MGVFKNEVGRPSNETIKKRNIFKGICVLLVVVIICLIAYILNSKLGLVDVKDNGKIVHKSNEQEEKGSKDEITSKKISFVGNYGVVVDYELDGEVRHEMFELYLREDGTFKYHHNCASCGGYWVTVGTYKVINDKIILEEKTHYGSDAVYWNEDLRTVEAKIINNDTLEITDIEGFEPSEKYLTLKYVKGVSNPETENSLKYYIIH